MLVDELISRLPSLASKKPVCLIGAVVIDQVVEVPALPTSGADIAAKQKVINVGGCALNVAITLHRLEIPSVKAFLVGDGMGADLINHYMEEQGMITHLPSVPGDNGWCIALVEPDGERTFISLTGSENNWTDEVLNCLDVQPESLIYISGYQLVSPSGEMIISWIDSLPFSYNLIVDFGPRIEVITADLMKRILALKPIISVNQDEAEYLDIKGDIEQSASNWSRKSSCPLIVRMGSKGAFYFLSDNENGWVPSFATIVEDTIGAGDSHMGGVLSGLSCGWNLSDAVCLGNAIASYVVSKSSGNCSPDIASLDAHLQVIHHS
jgi:sugar/nucleoside kinase (ribokinase family)